MGDKSTIKGQTSDLYFKSLKKITIMNYLPKHFFLFFFACCAFTSCSQSVPTAKASVKKSEPMSGYVFDVNKRAEGTAFYAMNSYTGDISYMLDFGESAGEWFNYGAMLKEGNGSPLLLKVVETPKGVAIYAMDSATGQLFNMLDHGNKPGEWVTFGGLIRQNALNQLQFEVVDRGEGNTTFYAYDSYTHKTYYMNLIGPNAGNWATYGNPYVEEK